MFQTLLFFTFNSGASVESGGWCPPLPALERFPHPWFDHKVFLKWFWESLLWYVWARSLEWHSSLWWFFEGSPQLSWIWWLVSASSPREHRSTLPITRHHSPHPCLRITSRQACTPLTSPTLQIYILKLACVSFLFYKGTLNLETVMWWPTSEKLKSWQN